MASYDPDLKLTGPLLLDEVIVLCPSCKGISSLTLTKQGFREVWPARLGCEACDHSEDHPAITNGLVEAAVEARTGRRRSQDRDTFTAEWRGLVLVGECRPQFVVDDLVVAGKALAGAGAKETGRWWKGKKKEAGSQVRQAVGVARQTARDQVGQATGAAKAAVLAAAWQQQSQGGGPAPAAPRKRCRVPGCRGGWVTITTRVHSSRPGKTRKERVPCAACHRSNNADSGHA
jgi:uracil-DNA glycosylase